MGLEMGLDLGWKNGLVMWASHVSTWHAGLMYFEIASRGKQMVSKEGLKNWHHFWVSICIFGGPNFAPPIPLNLVSERPQKWPP